MKKIVIIGGGATGIACAISLKEQLNNLAEVILIERLNTLGKKILATGNGKCNFSNLTTSKNHYNNEEFVTNLLNKYPPCKVVEFINRQGILSYTDSANRCYPYSNSAFAMQSMLIEKLKKNKVKVILEEEVKEINKTTEGYNIITYKNYQADVDYIVLATGGKTQSKLGSNGSGYRLLQKLDLTVTDIYPGLTGVKVKEKYIKNISGVRVKPNIKLIDNNGNIMFSDSGEIIFKDDGISGIVTMDLGSCLARTLKNNVALNHIISIDLMPEYSLEEVINILRVRQTETNFKKSQIDNLLNGLLNEKLGMYILKNLELHLKTINQISKLDINEIANNIKNLNFSITGLYDHDRAQVSIGGLNTCEVSANTYELNKYPNIYVGGELLDIDGNCGGYNLNFAISSGLLIADQIVGKIHDSNK